MGAHHPVGRETGVGSVYEAAATDPIGICSVGPDDASIGLRNLRKWAFALLQLLVCLSIRPVRNRDWHFVPDGRI